MLEKIRNIVAEMNVSDYRIVEKKTVSHQAFFVKQKLDQHRISDTTHTELTVYMDSEKDGKKFRGSAGKEIFRGESAEDIRKDIEGLKYNATLAVAPYYELVKEEKHSEARKEYDLESLLKTVVDAVQNVKDTATESINSYEIFVNEYYYHIVNSQGVDISFNTMNEEVEIIINSLDGSHEIELYHDVEFAGKPLNEITEGILEVFKQANDRTQAVPTKKMLNATVLLSCEDNEEFFSYFLTKANTNAVFNRMSQVKIGDPTHEGETLGDKVTVELKKELPFSSRNLPYSMDGNKARDLTIVEDGVYKSYFGDQKTAYYLGVEDAVPAFNIEVRGGTKTVEEMKKEPYLEIVTTSGFQMNPMTGSFGGEIRLGYYFDGEKTVPVTGGSITVNMNKVLGNMYMSKETKQYDNIVLPKTIQLFNVAVAGEE